VLKLAQPMEMESSQHLTTLANNEQIRKRLGLGLGYHYNFYGTDLMNMF